MINTIRLTQIASAPSADTTVSFKYQYNAANQRTAVTNADNSRWAFGYDPLGQVTSGRKYWGNATPVAGQQFDYTFDDIGNRKTTASGGDQYGANLRYANYTNNSLNQITTRDVPGYANVLGEATNTATVTLWSSSGAYAATSRKSNYFRGELLETNTSPLWLTITNLAVLNNGSNPDIISNTVGNVFLAQTPETFSYDQDGNLTNDGRWALTWDAENRLVNMTSLSGAPTGSKLKLDFAYDYRGRRIEKQASTNNGSGYVAQSTNRFVYDGWNVIAVLNPQAAIRQSFVWGLDLSGSLQGAGGVGGLLAMTDAVNGTHFFGFDGNGNVTALVQASDGTASANYEYGPFGELIRATGLMAKANPVRFSTKFQDDETDLCYYGYRYCNVSMGRWLSRDPLEEAGGINLYGFNFNDPINRIDTDGRGSITSPAAQQVLYQELLETIAAEMKMSVQQVIRRISLCTLTHSAYKSLNCKGCGFGCFTKKQAAERAACLASEVGLRATYLKLKCDYFLPGSVTRGSAAAEAGHKIELANKTAAMVKCTAQAAP